MNEYHVKIRGKDKPDLVFADLMEKNDDGGLMFFAEPKGSLSSLIACYADGIWEMVDEKLTFRDASDWKVPDETYATTGPARHGTVNIEGPAPEHSAIDHLYAQVAFARWWDSRPNDLPICEALNAYGTSLLLESLKAHRAGWDDCIAHIKTDPPEEDKSFFISPEYAAKMCRGHKGTSTSLSTSRHNSACEDMARSFELMGEY